MEVPKIVKKPRRRLQKQRRERKRQLAAVRIYDKIEFRWREPF